MPCNGCTRIFAWWIGSRSDVDGCAGVEERESRGWVKIHYSRIQLDEPLKLDFSVPSKYKRITFAQVIENDYESESIIYHEVRLDRSIGIVFIYRGLRSEIRCCPSVGAAAQGGVGRYRGDE